jgi:predicted metal-binding membrane protein
MLASRSQEADQGSPLRLLAPARTAVLLFGAAAVAWAVTVERMRGMDAGPGTDLGGIGGYIGVWVTMTAAMMLPSATPTAAVVARVSRGTPTVIFATGYLAVWTAYGLAAYGLFRLVTSFDTGWLDWDGSGPYVAGGAIAAAGIYELTPAKERFLRHCRGPLDYVGANGGRLGPLRIGLAHGLYCVSCCFGLMVVLFALGVMSVLWMAVIAGVIFAEKVLPHGLRLSRAVAPALVILGIWMAVSPSSVPGLTEPDRPPSMQMEM